MRLREVHVARLGYACVALLLLGQLACGPNAAPAAAKARWRNTVAGASEPSEPGAPTAVRMGLDAPLVWRSPAPVTVSGVQADQENDRLIVDEIRADANNVYFDVAHETVVPAREHDGTAARLAVGRNGCEVTPPRVSGTVWRDWAAPSTLTTSLTELPDGELQIVLSAFGQEQSWLLLKRGKSLRHMRLEESARYRAVPADPESGRPAGAVLTAVDCSRRVP